MLFIILIFAPGPPPPPQILCPKDTVMDLFVQEKQLIHCSFLWETAAAKRLIKGV